MATKSIVDYLNSQGQKSDFNSRAALAQQNNIQNYTGTAQQNTQLLGLLQKPIPTTPPTPTVPTVLTAEDVKKQNRMNVPSPTQPAPVDPFIASLNESQKQFQTMFDQANAQVQPIQEERAGLTERLKQGLEKLTGRTTRLVEEEQKLGINDNIKKLQEMNLQIAQKTGEFNKLSANVELPDSSALTTGAVLGQQGAIRRSQAAEIGALTSVAQALQGNISLAQQTAQRTVDLEFEADEQEVKNLQLLLEINKDNLTTAEKKRADELQFTLQERQREIEEKKEERKQVLSLSAQAAQNGADNATLTKMSQAKTTEEALQIGGQFLKEKEKRNTAVVEIGGKQKLIDTQTGETIKELGTSKEAELSLEKARLENQRLRVEMGLAPVGNAGQTADLNTFMGALSNQESGGNYNAENGRTGAFGKFQIMPANWPKWSVEAGLPAGSPQNPENQEKVAAFKLNQYYQKYGNWADVASVWYSGKPFSQVEKEGWADKKQGKGDEPSVREYVNSVLSKLPKQSVALKQDDAAKLNKEIATSDTYKAITKSQDAIRAVQNFEKVFNQQFKKENGKYNLDSIGEKAGIVKQAHKEALLVLKEYFNLGVLNGPDLSIIEEILPNPTNMSVRLNGGGALIEAGIQNMKTRIIQTLADRNQDLNTAYQDYDGSQLTNLQNAKRITEQLMAENEIKVKDKKTGQLGTIPLNEFDSKLYEKVK